MLKDGLKFSCILVVGPLMPASQHSRLAPLKVWFKWIACRGYLLVDPASELELPRIGYKLPNVLNKDEVELVLQQPNLQRLLGLRDRAMLEIFYSTGIRRTELLQLRLYDVDKKNGLVTVREGKGRRDRVVPILYNLFGAPLALDWFYRQVRNHGPWDYKQGKTLNDFGSPDRQSPFEDFGNFNYGATAAALGIPESVALRGAGWASTRADPSRSSQLGHWWGAPPYGDDPEDQIQIKLGYLYFKLKCYK